ncbi:hypothetical protein G3480_21935 [Thiorhodococcus mannitoliphagus]|uniref:Uncharacterized protein n=1 Tax=Thiorhodococcus mannitoliphagus TaxID=329406 RepID=A0A6P1DZ22_9GAMM|nr:hypothetical protein [Thiorhodococcus mannitoliphagus]NEX22929.1 hypothetical protein [Thiorhodococcus mannitoliphagus]
MGLRRDDLGFVRSNSYGQIRRDELERVLNIGSGESVYRSGVDNGVRTGQVVTDAEVALKPGDTFSAGPRVVKGAGRNFIGGGRVVKGAGAELPAALRREIDGLRRAGFGGVDAPTPSPEGWRLRLRGLTLPGGVRTDALILLPKTYPLAAPIGFYLRKGAETAQLDRSHLYDRSYHGAPDLASEGWQWYCGVADNWRAGCHTLISYMSVTLAFFADAAVR